MKTFQQWNASRLPLNTFLRPGDEIDDELTDHFVKLLPPLVRAPDLIQTENPYTLFRGRNGNIQGIYATLVKKNGVWIYAGHCFEGESEAARHHLFIRKESENPEYGLSFFRNIHNSALHYLLDSGGQWHGMNLDGRLTGPVKGGVVIHIITADGTQSAEEITKEPEDWI